MRKLIFLLIISLFWYSCSCTHSDNSKHSEVTVKSNKDTIVSGEMYSAELYVPYNDSIAPSFFIKYHTDTLQLPMDRNKKCAQFNMVGRKSGKKTINGFVEFLNEKGEKEKREFIIKFYVK
jgi:hypothetical protein